MSGATPKPKRQPEGIMQTRFLLAFQAAWPEARCWVDRTGTAWTRDGSRPISYGPRQPRHTGHHA